MELSMNNNYCVVAISTVAHCIYNIYEELTNCINWLLCWQCVLLPSQRAHSRWWCGPQC